MFRKPFWLMWSILFSAVILASCANSAHVSANIPTPTLLPQKPIMVATPTIQPTETAVIPTPTQEPWCLLILGDSSLWNAVDIYPPIIERDLGGNVVVEDYSLGGLAMYEVLQVLKTGESDRTELLGLPNAISEAEMVVMFIGNPAGSINPENSFNMNGCLFDLASPENCDPSSLERYTTDLKWIWGEIFRLRNGKPTILRTMDLYPPLINDYIEKALLLACTTCLEN